jgi:hypothetical protein
MTPVICIVRLGAAASNGQSRFSCAKLLLCSTALSSLRALNRMKRRVHSAMPGLFALWLDSFKIILLRRVRISCLASSSSTSKGLKSIHSGCCSDSHITHAAATQSWPLLLVAGSADVGSACCASMQAGKPGGTTRHPVRCHGRPLISPVCCFIAAHCHQSGKLSSCGASTAQPCCPADCAPQVSDMQRP